MTQNPFLGTAGIGALARLHFLTRQNLPPRVAASVARGAAWLILLPLLIGAACGKAAADSISIQSPVQWQMFNMSDGAADIAIRGQYSGQPAAIEASWNGHDWFTIDAAPTDGVFSGLLPAQPHGQGALSVRFADAPSVAGTVANVGIGWVFIIAGQSNADGAGENLQTYEHPALKPTVFRESSFGAWRVANDPVGSSGSRGTCWPLLATHIMAQTGVPVGFIETAKGGVGLASPRDWPKLNPTIENRYALMLDTVARSNVNGASFVLWHQGETDAFNGDPAMRALYRDELIQLALDMRSDLPGAPLLAAAQIGQRNLEVPAGLDRVRAAQADAWADENILPGPVLYDIDLGPDPLINPNGDYVHFKSDAHLQMLADRWWMALRPLLTGEGSGRGPVLSSIGLDHVGTGLYLDFDCPDAGLAPDESLEGFRVYSAGVELPIAESRTISPTRALIRLQNPAPGPVTVSLGAGNDGAGAAVPRDVSIFGLPVEPFYDQPATPIVYQAGDVNRDQSVNANDIDELRIMFGSPYDPACHDLNHDGRLDEADVAHLLHGMLNSAYGDLDLDGRVGIGDLTILAEQFGSASGGWALGDLNGDGKVGIGDLTLLGENYGFTSISPMSGALSIPAPSMVWPGGLLMLHTRRKAGNADRHAAAGVKL